MFRTLVSWKNEGEFSLGVTNITRTCRVVSSSLSSPSLSLIVRDKLCNPAGVIRNFAGFNFLQSIHARFRIVIRFALTERYRSILFRSTDEKQISEIFCYLRTDITKNLLPVFSNGSTILMNCANFTRQTWWMRGKCTMQSYSRYLFNVIERIRARNKFVFTYYKFCEGGRWKNRDICNFCNPFESIQNIYIYITSYPNLVETKRTNIFTFESQEDVLILSFRTFSRDPGHPWI